MYNTIEIKAENFGLVSGVKGLSAKFNVLIEFINSQASRVNLEFPAGEIDLSDISIATIKVPIKIIGNNTVLIGGGTNTDLFTFQKEFEVDGISFRNFRFPLDFEQVGAIGSENSQFVRVMNSNFENIYSPLKAYPKVGKPISNTHFIDEVRFENCNVSNCITGVRFRFIGINKFYVTNSNFHNINYDKQNIFGNIQFVIGAGSFGDSNFLHILNTVSYIENCSFTNIKNDFGRIYGAIFYRGDRIIQKCTFNNFRGLSGQGVAGVYFRGLGNSLIEDSTLIDCSNTSNTGMIITKSNPNFRSRFTLRIKKNSFSMTNSFKAMYPNQFFTGADFTKINTEIIDNTFENLNSPFTTRMERSNYDDEFTTFEASYNKIINCKNPASGRLITLGFKRDYMKLNSNTFINESDTDYSIFVSSANYFEETKTFEFNNNIFLIQNHSSTHILFLNSPSKHMNISGNNFVNGSKSSIEKFLLLSNSKEKNAVLNFNGNIFEYISMIGGGADSCILDIRTNLKTLICKGNVFKNTIQKFTRVRGAYQVEELIFSDNYINDINLEEDSFFRFDGAKPKNRIQKNNLGIGDFNGK